MITSKQRATLRGIAQNYEPIVIIGKEGISATILSTISDVLNKRELMKVKLLNNADLDSKEAIAIVCEKLMAEPVQSIGNVFVIYRRSDRKDIKHIEF